MKKVKIDIRDWLINQQEKIDRTRIFHSCFDVSESFVAKEIMREKAKAWDKLIEFTGVGKC